MTLFFLRIGRKLMLSPNRYSNYEKKEVPAFHSSVMSCVFKIKEDIMYSISSQIGATKSGLLGQHLASTVLADIRLVCVLSALFFYLLCLSLSLYGSLILPFSVS